MITRTSSFLGTTVSEAITTPYVYHIHGFVVVSEFPFPADSETRSLNTLKENDQIVVRRASLTGRATLSSQYRSDRCYDVGDGIFLHLPCADIHIDYRGRAIKVDAKDEDIPAVCAWVVHIGLSTVHLLRGHVPLHAASVEINGKLVALLAQSGAGKSTLCYYLVHNAYARFASDDIVPVAFVDHNAGTVPFTLPATSLYPKLHSDTADALGVPPALRLQTNSGYGRGESWILLSKEQRIVEPRPLAAVVCLVPVDHNPNAIQVERVNVDTASRLLADNLHGLWIFGCYFNAKAVHKLCVELAAKVPIFTLRYHRSFSILPQLAKDLENLLGSMEGVDSKIWYTTQQEAR